MTWRVSMTDDEIWIFFRNGLNEVAITIDELGPHYCIRETDGWQPGQFELKGDDFIKALADISQACKRS